MTSSPAASDSRRWRLTAAGVGVGAATALILVSVPVIAGLQFTQPHLALVLSYLAVWVPLLGAVVACYLKGSRSLSRDFGLRFRPLDLLWGLAIGLLARVASSLLEIIGYGQMGSSAVTLEQPVYDGWWAFGVIVAPIILAPVIEELFFRGLLLRALIVEMTASVPAKATAILVSAAIFAALHIVEAGSGIAALVVGLSTFIVGVALATLAVLTGRLGGAVIAHITFNALGIVPGLL